MTTRQRLAIVLFGLAVGAGVAGTAFLLWAGNRPYADLQRNYGYLFGALGLLGAMVLAAIAAALRRADTRR